MIPTGTPARAAQRGADRALENWTGQPAVFIPEKFKGVSPGVQSIGSRSSEPGRSPLRLRMIV